MNELNILLVGLNLFGPPQSLETLGLDLQRLFESSSQIPVKVVTEDIRRRADTVLGMNANAASLFTWHFWPYPDFAERNRRWATLRGEAGTEWDWIILAENPETLLLTPGFHAAAVAAIQQETHRGSAKLLLMIPPPPSDTAEDTNRIRTAMERTAASAGIPAAPAALALQNAGPGLSPDDRLLLTAATLFSRITGELAPLPPNKQPLAALALETVANHAVPPPSADPFPDPHPFAILGDTRPHINFSHKGTSTERDLTAAVHTALTTLNRSANSDSFTGTYTSNSPLNDALGWPQDAPLPIAFNLGRHPDFVDDGYKSYVTNPEFWQLGFAFAYQHFTSEYPLDDANAHFIAMIEPLDLAVARHIRSEHTARAVPLRALWALIHRQYPAERYQRDRVHLNRGLLKAAGVFIATLYTGESPVQTVSTDPAFAGREDYDLFCQRTGYELALQLGHVHTRPAEIPAPPTSP